MSEDRCVNCIYCAEVRKRPVYNTVLTKICLFFAKEENYPYILEVFDTDRCECFKNK